MEITKWKIVSLANEIEMVLNTCDIPSEKHETMTRKLRQIKEQADSLVDSNSF